MSERTRLLPPTLSDLRLVSEDGVVDLSFAWRETMHPILLALADLSNTVNAKETGELQLVIQFGRGKQATVTIRHWDKYFYPPMNAAIHQAAK